MADPIIHPTGDASSLDRQVSPWKTLSSSIKHDDPFIELRVDQVITPAGTRGEYRVIHYKSRAVSILPIDAEGYTTLVGQYRYTLNRYSWELPGGGGALDENPDDSARRELAEETGLTAAHLLPVLRMDVSNGITDEQGICYLAWSLTRGDAHPDESEALAVWRVPFEEALEMAHGGGITEVVSVVSLLRVGQLVQSGEAPAEVLAAVHRRVGP